MSKRCDHDWYHPLGHMAISWCKKCGKLREFFLNPWRFRYYKPEKK